MSYIRMSADTVDLNISDSASIDLSDLFFMWRRVVNAR